MSNATRNIIVIGASAGGFEAIKTVIGSLPRNFDAAVFVVWHISPDVRGILPQVLSRLGNLPVTHAMNGEAIKAGHVYIAPPDHHMLLEKGIVRVTRGPKENRFRPAVDPLFRSAAYAYGSRVVGVILSGALDDGTAGLWTVKQAGGIAIVQHPEEAEVPSMPENAMRAVPVDHIIRVAEIGPLLAELSQKPSGGNGLDAHDRQQTKTEISIAMEEKNFIQEVWRNAELSPYTCPECHGVLARLKEDGPIRFRCHTGHAFSADSLLASITEGIEESLWGAIRNVQESIMLLNHMGDHFAEVNKPRLAATYFNKAKDAEQRMKLIREAVLEHELLSTGSIEEQAGREDNDTPGD